VKFAERRRISAQFGSLAAPETGDFEPKSEDFGILSLFRNSLVPRENTAQTRRLPGRSSPTAGNCAIGRALKPRGVLEFTRDQGRHNSWIAFDSCLVLKLWMVLVSPKSTALKSRARKVSNGMRKKARSAELPKGFEFLNREVDEYEIVRVIREKYRCIFEVANARLIKAV
jgi:hypothetical protein